MTVSPHAPASGISAPVDPLDPELAAYVRGLAVILVPNLISPDGVAGLPDDDDERVLPWFLDVAGHITFGQVWEEVRRLDRDPDDAQDADRLMDLAGEMDAMGADTVAEWVAQVTPWSDASSAEEPEQ